MWNGILGMNDNTDYTAVGVMQIMYIYLYYHIAGTFC